MGNWNQVHAEVKELHSQSPYDRVRRKKIKALHNYTKRNVLCYYSGWLQKTAPEFQNIVTITDEDKNGFMSCFYKMDFERGLDFLIHSPGGNVSATESLINYIRSKFSDDIRVFVPQIAMSGGTILALSGKNIFMGNQSNLGPIDPQFGHIPAVTLLEEVENAYKEIQKDPGRVNVWAPILSQISPTFLTLAKQALDMSKEIAVRTLCEGMLKGTNDSEVEAEKIAQELTDTRVHKEHGRHIHKDDCKRIGLKISDLEDDDKLQDIVLSIHHAFMLTLSNTAAAKIIENHHEAAYIRHIQQQLVLQQQSG